MTITELTTAPDLTAPAPSDQAGRIGTTFRHTWYLTGPAEFPVAKRVYIAVDEDAGRARERMAAALIDVYGTAFGSGLLPVTVLGPPDACVRGLREVADAGAGMILLTALFDQPAQMERLAAEVVPNLS